MVARIQIQAQPSTLARKTRHRIAQIPYVHLREWLLLARSRRMQILQDAEDEYGVLGEENLTQQGKRPGGTETAGKDEVALHHRLGV